jgi:hypothetical protein
MEHFKPKFDRIKDACSDDENWSDEYEAIEAKTKKTVSSCSSAGIKSTADTLSTKLETSGSPCGS